jgi:hypothetical protein
MRVLTVGSRGGPSVAPDPDGSRKTMDEDERTLHPKREQYTDQDFIYVGKKDFKRVQKAAWDAGWWPAQKRSGLMWQSPDQRFQVMVHGTSSDHHAFNNMVAEFRKAGLKI